MNSSAYSPRRHRRHTTCFGKPQSIMPVVPRAGGKLPRLGAGEEITGLIFSDGIQNGSYVCKIPKVHNLNNNPFRTLQRLIRHHPPKIFGSKGFEENDFRIRHTGNPKRPSLSAPQHRSSGCWSVRWQLYEHPPISPFACFLISIDFDGESISRTDLYVKEILTTVEFLNADRSQSS